MLSPATILKLWKRVNDRFGPAGEDPKGKGDAKTKVSTKAKQAEKEDTRINKGLTNLRNRARGDLTTPVAAAAFLKSRDVTVKSMHKYCKLLRGNDLKDSVKDLTRFRKAVKQLTVAVAALKVGPFPKEEEQGEGDLNELDGVDTGALDRAMEDPKFGEYADAELDEPDTDQTAEKPTAALFAERVQALSPSYQHALKAGASNRGALEKAMKLALAAAKSHDYAQAMALLDTLEAELAKAGGTDPAAAFKARLQTLTPGYQHALKAGAPNHGALEKAMKLALAAAKSHDYAQAMALLDTLEAELAKAGSPPSVRPADPAELFKQRVQAFRASYNQALAQARANNPELAEELDGLFAQMFDEAKARKFETALQTLDELTRLVNSALQSPTAGEETEQETPTTNMGIWNQTKDKVDADINRLCDFLRKTRAKALVEAAAKLAAAMDLFKVDLTSALMNMDKANPAQKKKLLPKVSQVLDNYRQSLQADQMLSAAEDNPFVPVKAKQPLLAALDRIKKNLEAQVGA